MRQPSASVLPKPQPFFLVNVFKHGLTALGQRLENARTRRLLAQLDDRQLSDTGISHSERAAELNKPFWG